MARRFSPYYVNEGRYGGVGEAVGNLGSIFADALNPVNDMRTDNLAWDSRIKKEKVTDTMDARQGRNDIGAMFTGAEDFSQIPVNQVIGQAISSGGMKIGDLDDLFMVSAGNMGGSDEDRAGAYVGMGKTIDTGDAFSLDDREFVAGREFDNDLALQDADNEDEYRKFMAGKGFDQQNKPLSRDQLVAQAYQMGGPEAAKLATESLYRDSSGSSANNVWLDAKRRSELEADVTQALTDYIAASGGYPDEAPADLYSGVADRAMQYVQDGDTPNAAVGKVMQEIGFEVEPDHGLIPFDTDDFTYDFGQMQGQGQPQGSDAGGAPVVNSDEDYDALPSGTKFIDGETGDTYVKP